MKEIFQEYGGVLITTFISQARANGNFTATP